MGTSSWYSEVKALILKTKVILNRTLYPCYCVFFLLASWLIYGYWATKPVGPS